MVNDKELADAVVGILNPIPKGCSFVLDNSTDLYGIWDGEEVLPSEQFVRDWRVAGVCLGRWPTTINTEHLDCTLDEMLRNPRAIIEAYVHAVRARQSTD